MIAVFRHGETVANAADKLQGWTDSSLTNLGRLQVAKTAKNFMDEHGDQFDRGTLLSSDLGRSLASVQIFEKYCNIKMWTIPVKSLRELFWGDWEGHLADDHLEELEKRNLDGWNWKPPSGESYLDLKKRVKKVVVDNGFLDVSADELLIYHVHQNVSAVLRGIYLGIDRSRIVELDHHFEEYFVW